MQEVPSPIPAKLDEVVHLAGCNHGTQEFHLTPSPSLLSLKATFPSYLVVSTTLLTQSFALSEVLEMKPSLKLYLWLFTFQLGALSKPGWGDRPVAQLDSGTAVGFTKTDVLSGVKLNAWLGIPFAGEPLRWGPPKPPKTWGAPFDASKLGPACIQQFNYPEPRRGLIRLWFNTPTPTESEDCLNVCVYAPYGHHKKPKAVLVWYYGGGLLYGSNAVDKYDFSNMAANNDVVVVVPNYRTNGFGFPGSPQIPVEEGNPGYVVLSELENSKHADQCHSLLDQRLALDWVRRNIAAFGGDPEQVTIFGESAGAAR